MPTQVGVPASTTVRPASRTRSVESPARSAWAALVKLIDKILPVLRRIWNYLKPFLRKAVPFSGGLILGPVAAVLVSGVTVAVALALPYTRVLEFDRTPLSRSRTVGFRLLQPLRLVLALGAAAVGFAAGAINGLLLAPAMGLALAFPAGLAPGIASRFSWGRAMVTNILRSTSL